MTDTTENHLSGEERSCTHCQNILAWKAIIQKLTDELEEIEVALRPAIKSKKIKAESNVSKNKEVARSGNQEKIHQHKYKQVKLPKIKLFRVELEDGQEHLYRFSSKQKVIDYVADNNSTISVINRVKTEDYEKFYLEREAGTYVNLEVLEKAELEGLIGEKKEPEQAQFSSFNCTRTVQESAIVFNGKNHSKVIDFCHPLQATRTKKGNKIQVTTLRGSIAVSPFDYLVKYNSRLEVFTKNEFDQIYLNQIEKKWITKH